MIFYASSYTKTQCINLLDIRFGNTTFIARRRFALPNDLVLSGSHILNLVAIISSIPLKEKKMVKLLFEIPYM